MKTAQVNEAIVTALAGTGAEPAAMARAWAAYTVAKLATLSLLAAGRGHLDPSQRAELLAAAVRALGP